MSMLAKNPEPTPRVNYQTMQSMQGRRVVLICELKGMRDAAYVVRTPDDAEVLVRPQHSSGAWEGPYVQVTGTVQDNKTLLEESHQNIKGPAVDLRLVNELVKLSSGKHAAMFSP